MTDALIESILTRLPSLTIGVLGDLFLDRYLDIDDTLTEPSLETGLDAYQVPIGIVEAGVLPKQNRRPEAGGQQQSQRRFHREVGSGTQ